jgi:hypothetical protein
MGNDSEAGEGIKFGIKLIVGGIILGTMLITLAVIYLPKIIQYLYNHIQWV